jgi:hypothetical protein
MLETTGTLGMTGNARDDGEAIGVTGRGENAAAMTRARTWYVVDAFIPAMRIDTAPPPGGDGTGAVERP